MERESFIFYKSFYEAIRRQPKKIQADLYNAVCEYVFLGKEPEKDAVLGFFLLIQPQIDANNKKYENGKKGGAPVGNQNARKNPPENSDKEAANPCGERVSAFGPSHLETTKKQPKDNQKTTEKQPKNNQKQPNVNVNVNVNENENGNENENENGNANGNENEKETAPKGRQRKQAFTPPTLTQVQEYVAQRGNRMDAERFYDFYTSKGWMVGKNKMKDWQAAVRNWERQDAEIGASNGYRHGQDAEIGASNGRSRQGAEIGAPARNSANVFYDIGREEGLF